MLDRWIGAHPSLAASLNGFERASPVRGMMPVGARSRADAGPGYFLAGDAAGFFDPFTGEGIYRALVGGEIAAKAAVAALQHGYRPADVDRYHRARRNAFTNKEIVTMLVQAFVRFPYLLDYALPRLESRSGAGAVLASVLGDVADARTFLRPRPLWEVLRP
jgi:flavin-dependent dehydrogenase